MNLWEAGEHSRNAPGARLIELWRGCCNLQFLLLSLVFALIGWFLDHQHRRRQALQLQATEAQLLRLQAQIEPHFLFNSLAAVQSLIKPAPDRALEMLEHFTDYLRASLAALEQRGHVVGRGHLAAAAGSRERRVAVAGGDIEHALARAHVERFAELFADDLQRGADDRVEDESDDAEHEHADRHLGTSTEGIARFLFETFDPMVRKETGGRAWVRQIILHEDTKNVARYQPDA